MSSKLNLDALGVTTSLLCAIHCALLPLLMASLPILGINIIHNTGFEYGMIGLALIIGVAALRHGLRRHHRRHLPLLLFGCGMMLLVAKEIWPSHELVILPFAVFPILGAHWLNFRWSRTRPETPFFTPNSRSGNPQ
jgi:hypothetical protein